MATRKSGGAKGSGSKPNKESSDRMSAIGARAMRGDKMTPAEIKSMGASIVSQDVTRGPRGGGKKK